MSDDYQRRTAKLKKEIAELETFIESNKKRVGHLEVRLHRLEAAQKSFDRTWGRTRAYRRTKIDC